MRASSVMSSNRVSWLLSGTRYPISLLSCQVSLLSSFSSHNIQPITPYHHNSIQQHIVPHTNYTSDTSHHIAKTTSIGFLEPLDIRLRESTAPQHIPPPPPTSPLVTQQLSTPSISISPLTPNPRRHHAPHRSLRPPSPPHHLRRRARAQRRRIGSRAPSPHVPCLHRDTLGGGLRNGYHQCPVLTKCVHTGPPLDSSPSWVPPCGGGSPVASREIGGH